MPEIPSPGRCLESRGVRHCIRPGCSSGVTQVSVAQNSIEPDRHDYLCFMRRKMGVGIWGGATRQRSVVGDRSLGGARRRPCRTILPANGPGFDLLLVADRTVGVARSYVDGPEAMLLKKRRHWSPGRRRRTALRDMLAHAAHSQHWNRRHLGPPLNDAHSRDLYEAVELGASLGANKAHPMTQCRLGPTLIIHHDVEGLFRWWSATKGALRDL
jgi:hypothetical protein